MLYKFRIVAKIESSWVKLQIYILGLLIIKHIFMVAKVELLFLSRFPGQKADRFEDGGLMLYGLSEEKVKEALINLNKQKKGEGKINCMI